MPKSPVATQKFVSDELFKYNTQIAKDLLSFQKEMRAGFVMMNKRFEQVDKRFEQIDERFDGIDERLDGNDERLDAFVTKTEMLGYKVELMDELKFIREELAANSSIDIRQNKEIEDHEERLGAIEVHLNLAVA
ncbi:MAG: hypothetical protein ABIJ22_00415 [Patescibacteria group bacterium]